MQNRIIQTSQTGGQKCSDTSPLVFPDLALGRLIGIKIFIKTTLSIIDLIVTLSIKDTQNNDTTKTLGVIILSVVVLGVAFSYCSAECHYAECYYAVFHYAECHCAECHYAECHYAESHYAESHYGLIMLSLIMISLC